MRKIPFLYSFIILILSGCLYPQSELAENQMPSEAQIQMVQTAVDQYREQTGGLVPIKTKPLDTPIFEKYIIEFDLLKNENFLNELPGNSFEKGGYYQYALINPEDNPTVKLIDVRIANELQKVYTKLHIYLEKNAYLPLSDHLQGEYFLIDYKKLGLQEEPHVTSPYSKEQLPIIIDNTGTLYVDYRLDLHREIEKTDASAYDDIRYILVDHSPFLPIYAPQYAVEDDHPILRTE